LTEPAEVSSPTVFLLDMTPFDEDDEEALAGDLDASNSASPSSPSAAAEFALASSKLPQTSAFFVGDDDGEKVPSDDALGLVEGEGENESKMGVETLEEVGADASELVSLSGVDGRKEEEEEEEEEGAKPPHGSVEAAVEGAKEPSEDDDATAGDTDTGTGTIAGEGANPHESTVVVFTAAAGFVASNAPHTSLLCPWLLPVVLTTGVGSDAKGSVEELSVEEEREGAKAV